MLYLFIGWSVFIYLVRIHQPVTQNRISSTEKWNDVGLQLKTTVQSSSWKLHVCFKEGSKKSVHYILALQMIGFCKYVPALSINLWKWLKEWDYRYEGLKWGSSRERLDSHTEWIESTRLWADVALRHIVINRNCPDLLPNHIIFRLSVS